MIPSMKEWANKHPDVHRTFDHNDRMHQIEPEVFEILKIEGFERVVLRGKQYEFGFCVNSVEGGGYHDGKMIWIADDITDPRLVIECAVHECLHAWFPHLSEKIVVPAGQEIASFVVSVFKAKKVELPTLKPLLDPDDKELKIKLFPPEETEAARSKR